MTTSTMTSAAVRTLGADLAGELVLPGEPTYAGLSTTWVGGYVNRPAAVVRAADTRDVALTVRAAADHGLELAVRSGGHSGAGLSTTDGGLLLDLARLDSIEVELEPGREVVRAGAGLTAGAVTETLAPYRCAVPFGDTGVVGISGLTLGGGLGYLTRRDGLTIDSVLGAEVVTADGRTRTATPESEPDLFWALRGGGGNVGVVTRWTYRPRRAGTVLGGMLVLPAGAETLLGLVDAAVRAPRELSVVANVMLAPRLPFLPTHVQGRPAIMAQVAWSGDVADGDAALAPLRDLAEPYADVVDERPYAALVRGGPPPRPGGPLAVAVRNGFVERLTFAGCDEALAFLGDGPELRMVQLRVLGGAVADVPADATAYAHREEELSVHVAVAFPAPDGADALVAARARYDSEVRQVAGTLGAEGRGAYVNALGHDAQDRVQEVYPGATYARLAAVKRAYDPENLFRRNVNVPPA